MFPNRRENVFFSSYGCRTRAFRHKRQWKRSERNIKRFVEEAVRAGGTRFFCAGGNFADYTFMKIVSECKRKYPDRGIQLIVCLRTERHQLYLLRNDEKAEDLVDVLMTLFTKKPRVLHSHDYEATLALASGRVIGYVQPSNLENSKMIRACDMAQVPFFNYCSDTIVETRALVDTLFSLPDLQCLARDWASEQEQIVARMENPSDIALANRLREVDRRYSGALLLLLRAHGQSLISQYADDLVWGVPGFLQRQPSKSLLSRQPGAGGQSELA